MPRKFDTTPERSRVMSLIRSKETKCEVLLRKHLWKIGVRGYRKYPALPGKPDLLFPKKKVIIFVDGCFWHGCPIHYRAPKSNTDYWSAKVLRNVHRDEEINKTLSEQGYSVLRLWEHEVFKEIEKATDRILVALDRKT